MAYSNFTSDDLTQRLGLTFAQRELFRDIVPLDPGSWLLETLDRGRPAARFNEKSRSEFIVAPILTRLRDFLGERFAFFSGAFLDVDVSQGLNGECDFLLARSLPVPFLQPPLMVVVEAKKGDIEAGLPQCIAQMVGIRLYNERAGKRYIYIHGALTTGDDWQFLRLQESTCTIDRDKYYLSDLGRILGILVDCLKEETSP